MNSKTNTCPQEAFVPQDDHDQKLDRPVIDGNVAYLKPEFEPTLENQIKAIKDQIKWELSVGRFDSLDSHVSKAANGRVVKLKGELDELENKLKGE